ncbi:MAG: hypothetical protein GX879_06295, partial [Bacteroidales bacterium]|nr:hypothetical protein [Bacteroidales bacterium]
MKQYFTFLFLVLIFLKAFGFENDIMAQNINIESNNKVQLEEIEAEKQKISFYDKQKSTLNEKWERGGIFEGYTPEQEIISKRTQGGKYFQNPDGSTTAQIGGNYHYLDDNKAWQDIDLIIKPENYRNYAYVNKTNTFKTFYPQTAGNTGFRIKSDEIDINIWKSPELIILDNNENILYQETAKNSSPKLNKNSLVYNSFNNIQDELKLIDFGVENNIYINEFNNEWANNQAKYICFKQTLNFNSDIEVLDSKGSKQSADFEDEIIGFKFSSGKTLYLNALIVFDALTNKEEAQQYFGAEKPEHINKDARNKSNSFYKGNYKIVFIDGGIEVHSTIEINWLKNANFPVCVDPTWTIGATTNGSYYGPLTHWYGYQRHANLYLQSEIGGYGIISKIEYYKTNTPVTTDMPTKVFMRNTTLTSLNTNTWNSTTYTGGLPALLNTNTSQDGTEGWKALNLSNFNYDSGNLLIMVYDAFGGTGGTTQYFAQRSDATSLGAAKRQDSSDPGDASAMTVENYRHTIRITYSSTGNTYCTPEGTNSGRYIDNFSTSGGTINIVNNNSGFSSGGYGNFSSSFVQQNAGQQINFSTDIVGGTAGFRIWVDWSGNDYCFSNPNHLVYSSGTYVNTGT